MLRRVVCNANRFLPSRCMTTPIRLNIGRTFRATTITTTTSTSFIPIRRASCQSTNTDCVTFFDPAGCYASHRSGLILGVYSDNDGRFEPIELTPSGKKYNELVCGKVIRLLTRSGPIPKLGEYRVYYDLDKHFNAIAIVGLGPDCQGYNPEEQLDEGKEAIRIAAAVGVRALLQIGMEKISTESFEHAESAAEGAALSLYLYQEHKNCKCVQPKRFLDLWNDCDWNSWQIGLQKAAAQNLARELTDAPANYMTPTLFAQHAVELLCKSGINVEVKVQNWAQCLGMGAFLLAGRGSCQPPIFLELSYQGTCNPKDRPVVLIGKGVTYNSGGIQLDKPHCLVWGRTDMSGAACVVATMRAIGLMKLPLNIRGLIPLIEHMPGCHAMKPGDVAVALNGKSIMVHETRAEGRMILADALAYSQRFWPLFTLDVGTMTKSVRTGLSTAATGVFTNSDKLWHQMLVAATHTGDRVWRMPLFKFYTKRHLDHAFDLKNVGRRWTGAAPCRVAAFLKEFVPCGEWIHLDNYGTNICWDDTDPPYLLKGVTGRPTRTMIEFICQLFCKDAC